MRLTCIEIERDYERDIEAILDVVEMIGEKEL